jgi:23S rRNA (adenine2030-N6)-methyltransferase
MLSYRHAFHAGNHADVLKHLVLMLCLQHFNSKDKPYQVVDTHAGAGLYSLHDASAQRTGEYAEGIGRLWDRSDLPDTLQALCDLIATANTGGRLVNYPGSPWIARALVRADDRLRLCELHKSDFTLLRREFGEDTKHLRIEQADGFEVLKAALPPPSRRGLVLIDPSYEIKSDYAKVVTAIKDALSRFATGTYLVWYPQLALLESNSLPERLRKCGARSWLDVRLTVQAPSGNGRGMHGSGMFVINPPWPLHAALGECLPYLAVALGKDDHATWTLEAYEQKPEPAPNQDRR